MSAMTPAARGDDVHGDAWARGARADHAVNVATGGPPPWLRILLRDALEHAVAAYPDEREAQLAVACRHGRAPGEVVMLNGAAQGFALIAAALGARRPVVVHPQFTEPDRALATAGRPARHLVLSDPYSLDPDAVPDDADLVVVGNPTNPTGVLHPRAAIEAIIKPGRVLVVDEAFMDFVPGEAESVAAAAGVEGLIVLRSLTKILAVPGLRVGYLLAPAALARRLREQRHAWPVNALALLAARAAATQPERLEPIAERAQRDRAALHHALVRDLAGTVHVHPGAANFLLTRHRGVDATALARRLRERHGIAVRPAATFPGLTAHHLRLTARGGDADARLVAALRDEAPEG
ncbi:MAG TPA: Rv2231c family pyridoxal phosphate-dependent protein CobC [Baekduia sp.]|nr:Rv2231c family pyridoxal phosphate-dependent protein CobC [Baekduia sp.]